MNISGPSARAMDLAAAVSGSRRPSLVPLGEGTDHAAYLVEGRWVLRERLQKTPATGDEVQREHQLLSLLLDVCPVAVPCPVAADPDAGILVVERIPGVPLIDVSPPPVEVVAPSLTEVMNALADVPRSSADPLVDVDDDPMAGFVAETAEVASQVGQLLRPDQRRRLDQFLHQDVPEEPDADQLRLCHHDLGAEHVLVSAAGTVAGIIDWSDAAWTDPARDLGRIARDLGRPVAERVARLISPDDHGLTARLRFHATCALVEDLAHGVTSGDHRYRDAAMASFDRTLAE